MVEIHCPFCGKYCNMLNDTIEKEPQLKETGVFQCVRCEKKWKIEISEIADERGK